MSERETKELEIQGHKVVLKAYVTARETLPIFKDKASDEMEKAHKLAEQVIVSIDGNSENIVEQLLDLPVGAYTQILTAVKDIANPDFPSAK